MSFVRYAAYQPSDEEWLGEIPAHWTVRSIKSLSPVMRGASPRPIDDPKYFDDEGDYAWVRIADVSASDGWLRTTSQRLSRLGQSLSVRLEPGALFISIAGSVGKPCITTIKACIHDGFVYFPKLEFDPRFLFRIFEAGLCYGGLGKHGTQLNLNTDTIGSIRIALPPPSELLAILDFLDRETAKIDALVDEQKQLIELLKEKRQAVISHAVTKGLDPNAPMKDSGVEWLGQVPAHWEVGPLKRYWAVTDCKHITAIFVENGFPLASIREVQNKYVLLDEAKKTTDGYYAQLIEGGREPKPGDLIFSRNATVGEVAQVADWHPPFAMGQDVCLLRRADERASPDFLQHIIGSDVVKEQLALAMVGATFKRVNVEEIRNLIIPWPDPAEQVRITNFLGDAMGASDQLIKDAEIAISLLQERRSALISAAVTGKIDVRGLAGAREAA